MSAVFISHSSADAAEASELRAALAERGIESTFLDVHPTDGIAVGDDWERKLYTSLRSCRALVAVNSQAYLASQWCHTEIAQAKALRTPIFPVRIDGSDIHALLRNTQALNLRGSAGDVAEAYDRLARGLKAAGIVDGSWDTARPPYPGLLAFEAEDAAVFFGREGAIGSVLEKLDSLDARSLRWLVMLGASGSGKSSLLRAGVLPRLDAGAWMVVGPMIPGAEPVTRLAVAFSDAFRRLGVPRDWKDLRQELRSGEPERWSDLATDLRVAAGRPDARVLLAVDQWEELLSRSDEGASERLRFAELSRALSEVPGGAFYLVATLRADYLGAFQNHPALRGLGVEEVVVRPIAEADLARVIEGPAQLAGVALEEGLVHEMIRDTQSEDALPLLAFALRELYETYGTDRLLEREEYRALGGLTQSVAVAAERVLTECGLRQESAPLPEEKQGVLEALRLSMLALVRLDERDQPVRRTAFWCGLPVLARDVLERFVQARLLVSSGEGAKRELRVAHEALFRSWPSFVEWLVSAKDLLAWRVRTTPLLDAWEGSGRDAGSLLRGAVLSEAVAVREREGALLTDAERSFVDQSEVQLRAEREREARRAARTLYSVIAVTCVILAVALLGWQQKRIADVNARRAQDLQRKAETNEQRASNATLLAYANMQDKDPMKAAAALREARGLVSPAFAPAAARLALSVASEAVLFGHSGWVTSLAFSPDGQHIVTGATDNSARIRRSDGSGESVVLNGHSDWVLAVAFSPDGSTVATSSSDKTVRLWNSDGSGTPRVLRGHTDLVLAIAFSPRGDQLASASQDHTARLWSLAEEAPPLVLEGHAGPVWSVAFSPDGSRLLTGSRDQTARLWATSGLGEPTVLRGHRDAIRPVAFSPDGLRALTGSDDGTARVWPLSGLGEVVVLQGHRGPLSSATFSPDGRRVVTGSVDQTARLWAADGEGRPTVLQGHTGWVTGVAFSPDGSRILTGSQDATARVWNGHGLGRPRVLRGHDGSVRAVAFSPDGTRVLTGSDDSTARLWPARAQGDLVVLQARSGPLMSATMSTDLSRIVLGSSDGTVGLWPSDGAGGAVVLDGKGGEVQAVALSPDGELVVSGSSDGLLRLWEVEAGREARLLTGHAGVVLSVAFSPDGRRVVSGSYDETVRIWPVNGEGEVVVLKGGAGAVLSVAFSPNGEQVVTGSSDGVARVWRADGQGAPVLLTGHTGPILAVAFSPDGRRVVAGADDHTARVWRADGTGSGVVLKGHNGAVRSVAFSPDGRRVLTGAEDDSVRLWHADGTGEAIGLEGLGGQVLFVGFSADGQRIAMASDRSAVRVTPVDWRTQLWRNTPYCSSTSERVTHLAKTEEQAVADLGLCQATAAACQPKFSTFRQCQQTVGQAYGPLAGGLLELGP